MRVTSFFLAVTVMAGTCFGSVFSFDGESRDGRLISGELDLMSDEAVITLEIQNPGEMGIENILDYSTNFIRFDEKSDGEGDIVLLQDFDGPVGGTLSLTGTNITTTAEVGEDIMPMILNGALTIWDDGADFNLTSSIKNWQTLHVPEPSTVIVGGVGFLILLIGSSYWSTRG